MLKALVYHLPIIICQALLSACISIIIIMCRSSVLSSIDAELLFNIVNQFILITKNFKVMAILGTVAAIYIIAICFMIFEIKRAPLYPDDYDSEIPFAKDSPEDSKKLTQQTTCL